MAEKRLSPSVAESAPRGTAASRSSTAGRAGKGRPVTVETAAVRVGGVAFTLPRPNRHHNVMWWLSVLGVSAGQMHDQGFVLSNGHYADREWAAKIAMEAGQITKLISPPDLYSEDLWAGGRDLPAITDLQALTRAPPPPDPQTEGDKSREAPDPNLQAGLG